MDDIVMGTMSEMTMTAANRIISHEVALIYSASSDTRSSYVCFCRYGLQIASEIN